MTPRQVRRRLMLMLRPMRNLVIGSVLCRIANQGLGVAIPAVAAGAVVRIGMGNGPEPVPLTVLIAGLALAKGLFRYLEQFTGHAVAFHLLAELRTDTFRILEPLAPAGLDDERSGDLVSRVVGDVDRIEPFFAHTIAPIAGAVLVPAITVIALGFATSWEVALVLAPFLAAMLVVPWLGRGRVAELAPELRSASGLTAATLTEAGQGIRDVVAFNAADRIAARLDEVEAPVAGLRRRLARIASLRTGFVDLLAAGAVVAVAAVAAADIGAVGLDGLAVAVTAAWVVATPARAVEEIVPDMERALAAGRRIFELADRPPPVSEPAPGASGPVPASGAVSMRSVTVRHHPESAPALDDVSLDLPDQGLVAVVGPSGSGKSTLVDVLLRFRAPDSGTITFDGVPLPEIPTSALRAHIAVVPQRPELFHGTIADNLRIGDPSANERRLWAVLERVGLADWVLALVRGIETPVGELGDRLSGGQRQRLALARALLRPGAILVVDEATSDLDRESEERVLETLRLVATRRTVLFVAHRLGTAAEADHVVVMDHGRIVAEGTHETLLEDGGVYGALWRRHADALA